MATIGIDAHKRNHTAVVVDEQGRQLAQRTTGSTSADHLALVAWAARHGAERRWRSKTAAIFPVALSVTYSPRASGSSECHQS